MRDTALGLSFDRRRGAGTGSSAKCAEAGGADLIIIYNSGSIPDGRTRDRWRALLPYGRCHAIVMEMPRRGPSGSSTTRRCWQACGGTDPFRLMDNFLRDVEAAGFAGVQNFPTVVCRRHLSRQPRGDGPMGYGPGVQMIATAASAVC